MARFVFLDPQAQELFVDWERSGPRMRRHAALLRGPLPRRPTPQRPPPLSVRSPEFRRWWADHSVCKHSTRTKYFHHPIVGALTVGFESLYVGLNLDLNLVTYTAEPNSPSAEAGTTQWSPVLAERAVDGIFIGQSSCGPRDSAAVEVGQGVAEN